MGVEIGNEATEPINITQDTKDGRIDLVYTYDPNQECLSSYERLTLEEPKQNCCSNKMLLFKTIASGQVLSVMLCGTGTCATVLQTFYNIRAPCFTGFLMYCLLSLTFGIYALTRPNIREVLRKHWWKYLIVSLLDVEANYLLTKAYSYTTLTSVQLCDSFTIPTVMVISFIFLRMRYKVIHYIGVAICLTGAIVLVFSDGSNKESNAPNEILGDVVALCAAILYGTANVGQEYLVKKYSSTIYLGMIGMYGVLISGIQFLILERDMVSHLQWNRDIVLLLTGFAVAQYFYYTVMPVVMKLSSATVVNLSLLSSDLYTLIVGLSLFAYKFSFTYFIAFSGIFIGLIVYNLKPTPTAAPRKKKTNIQNKFKNGFITDVKTRLWNRKSPNYTFL